MLDRQRFVMDWLRLCRFSRWIPLQPLPRAISPQQPNTIGRERPPVLVVGLWLAGCGKGAWQSVASREGGWARVLVTGCHLVTHGGYLAAQLLQYEELPRLVFRGEGLLSQQWQQSCNSYLLSLRTVNCWSKNNERDELEGLMMPHTGRKNC